MNNYKASSPSSSSLWAVANQQNLFQFLVLNMCTSTLFGNNDEILINEEYRDVQDDVLQFLSFAGQVICHLETFMCMYLIHRFQVVTFLWLTQEQMPDKTHTLAHY